MYTQAGIVTSRWLLLWAHRHLNERCGAFLNKIIRHHMPSFQRSHFNCLRIILNGCSSRLSPHWPFPVMKQPCQSKENASELPPASWVACLQEDKKEVLFSLNKQWISKRFSISKHLLKQPLGDCKKDAEQLFLTNK